MRYVDAHCHLDQYPEPAADAAACVDSQTYTIAVTNLPSEFARTQRYVGTRDYVRAAAGLHPEFVARFPYAVRDLLPLLRNTKYVGEVGLDYARATTEERQLQRQAFASIVEECERLGGRVLTVHSRKAATDVVEIVAMAKKSTIILHWYSGTLKILEKAAAAGCYFSVNPAMARSTSGRAIIQAIPAERILTESDGPFVQIHGRAMHPFQMREAVEEMAAVRQDAGDVFAAVVLQNFRRAVTIPV